MLTVLLCVRACGAHSTQTSMQIERTAQQAFALTFNLAAALVVITANKAVFPFFPKRSSRKTPA